MADDDRAPDGKRITNVAFLGNVIFESTVKRSPGLCRRIRVKLRDLLGQEPRVLFRTVGELADVVRFAPFKALETDRRIKLYVVFLSQKPLRTPTFPFVNSKEELEAVGMTNLEVFVVSRRKKGGFYGFPNNFIEKELGISATS